MPLLRGCGSPENDKSKGHIPSTGAYVDRNDSFCCTSVHEMPPMGIFFSLGAESSAGARQTESLISGTFNQKSHWKINRPIVIY